MQAGNVLYYSNANHKPNKMLSKSGLQKSSCYTIVGAMKPFTSETFFCKQA